jgi:hypothetical protein
LASLGSTRRPPVAERLDRVGEARALGPIVLARANHEVLVGDGGGAHRLAPLLTLNGPRCG